jgi:hypothetical protein
MRHHRITRSTALGLALAALAAPTAAAQQQDLRSPDTRDGALAASTAFAQQDLRSPDAKDTAVQSQRVQDLRWLEARNSVRSSTAAAPRKDYGKNAATGDYVTPDASPALAQERYLSSYGEPEPLTLPQSPAPSHDTPWLPIALVIAGALVIVAASATQLRRLRVRRRRAVRSTA